MASAYKWRITNNKYAFITDETGGDPFITDNVSSVNESEISLKSNQLNEENYSSKYKLMVEKIKSDPDGKSMDLPNYRYYYNIDNTSNCATINYGIQGTQGANGVGISNILQTKNSDGINTITFVLTDGTSYDIYINDGATGSVGLTGPMGEKGEQGADSVFSEDSVRRIVNEMNITSAVTESLDASLGEQYRELLKNYNDLSESYELLAGYLSATTITANEAYNKTNEKEQQLIDINSKVSTFESTLNDHTSNINTLNTVSDSLKESLNTASANIGTLSGFSADISLEFDKIKELVNINIGKQVLLSGFVENVDLRLDDFSENILANRGNIIALSGATSTINSALSMCNTRSNLNSRLINDLGDAILYLSGVTLSSITSIETNVSTLQKDVTTLNGKFVLLKYTGNFNVGETIPVSQFLSKHEARASIFKPIMYAQYGFDVGHRKSYLVIWRDYNDNSGTVTLSFALFDGEAIVKKVLTLNEAGDTWTVTGTMTESNGIRRPSGSTPYIQTSTTS